MNSKVFNWGGTKMRLSQDLSTGTPGHEAKCRPFLAFGKKLKAFLNDKEDGSQLVEMAMVFPIMLVLLTGMASFGMALYSQQQLGLAAASAVQNVSLDTSQISDPCATIESGVSKSLSTWTEANISYSLTVYTSTSSASSSGKGTGFTCKSLNADLTAFQPIVLTVSYPYSWFPIMNWSAWGSTFKPSGTLSTTQAAMIQ